MKKIPYGLIKEKLIQPGHIYPYTRNSKNSFLHFIRDEDTFFFLQNLVKYCEKKNDGSWPAKIDSNILKWLSDEFESSFEIEFLKAFKDGFIIKTGDDYELTHEFIVIAYLSCSCGDPLPLCTWHIDFTNEKKIISTLVEYYEIYEPHTLNFLLRLLQDVSTNPGVLTERVFSQKKLIDVATLAQVDLEICVNIAKLTGFIVTNRNHFVSCDNLIMAAYLASPKI